MNLLTRAVCAMGLIILGSTYAHANEEQMRLIKHEVDLMAEPTMTALEKLKLFDDERRMLTPSTRNLKETAKKNPLIRILAHGSWRTFSAQRSRFFCG